MGIALDYRDMENRVRNIEEKLDSLEKFITSISDMLSIVNNKARETDSRINVMSAGIDDARRISENTMSIVTDIRGSTVLLNDRIVSIDERLKRIEGGDRQCIQNTTGVGETTLTLGGTTLMTLSD